MSDSFPTDDEMRAETGSGCLEWFMVLDVWQEDIQDVSQISDFLMMERGLQPFWAQAVASQYLIRRM